VTEWAALILGGEMSRILSWAWPPQVRETVAGDMWPAERRRARRWAIGTGVLWVASGLAAAYGFAGVVPR
jgi:hypothetical protein